MERLHLQAIKEGNLEKVREHVQRGYYNKVSIEYGDAACIHGKVDILHHLLENGFHVSEWASIYASCNGHVDILDLLVKFNYIFSRNPIALFQATCNGHLECVKYLLNLSQLYAKDLNLVEIAIDCGKIGILEFLLTRPYSISIETWKKAPYASIVYLHKTIPNECPLEKCYHCKRIRCELLEEMENEEDNYLTWLSDSTIEKII